MIIAIINSSHIFTFLEILVYLGKIFLKNPQKCMSWHMGINTGGPHKQDV